jgi:hypothetical protein
MLSHKPHGGNPGMETRANTTNSNDGSAASPSAIQVNSQVWIRRIICFCLVFILIIALADIFLNMLQWLPGRDLRLSFNIARESSLGTWFSATQALFVSLTAFAILATKIHDSSWLDKFGWTIVACFFLFVSFDDAAKFHERFGDTLMRGYERYLHESIGSWFPSWGWQLFVAPFFALAGLFIFWFLFISLKPRLRYFVFAGLALFATAVGLDFVEGMGLEVFEPYNVGHSMRLLEEVLEMLGTNLFLYTFLTVLSERVSFFIELKAE